MGGRVGKWILEDVTQHVTERKRMSLTKANAPDTMGQRSLQDYGFKGIMG